MNAQVTERLPYPANPASTAENEGCAAWQSIADPDEEVMCSPTIVARINGVPACGWCTDACTRGAA